MHTLTNEKIIENVEIRILRPDLTEPILDENSRVLLRITIPTQTVPNLLSSASITQGENQVIESVMPQKSKKK